MPGRQRSGGRHQPQHGAALQYGSRMILAVQSEQRVARVEVVGVGEFRADAGLVRLAQCFARLQRHCSLLGQIPPGIPFRHFRHRLARPSCVLRQARNEGGLWWPRRLVLILSLSEVTHGFSPVTPATHARVRTRLPHLGARRVVVVAHRLQRRNGAPATARRRAGSADGRRSRSADSSGWNLALITWCSRRCSISDRARAPTRAARGYRGGGRHRRACRSRPIRRCARDTSRRRAWQICRDDAEIVRR